mmetsp:Transcript_31478/g.83923  ORF Transcript_31478/g.83923 Transcript_31478/m.83923 type:complete len:203 (+) Transcript_31478:208-816(+)
MQDVSVPFPRFRTTRELRHRPTSNRTRINRCKSSVLAVGELSQDCRGHFQKPRRVFGIRLDRPCLTQRTHLSNGSLDIRNVLEIHCQAQPMLRCSQLGRIPPNRANEVFCLSLHVLANVELSGFGHQVLETRTLLLAGFARSNTLLDLLQRSVQLRFRPLHFKPSRLKLLDPPCRCLDHAVQLWMLQSSGPFDGFHQDPRLV